MIYYTMRQLTQLQILRHFLLVIVFIACVRPSTQNKLQLPQLEANVAFHIEWMKFPMNPHTDAVDACGALRSDVHVIAVTHRWVHAINQGKHL